ncbi:MULTISPECIES: hypothetical protein [unclassified Streptomyces]|uniref:hypothetical protein n=1 Tax=unclassified Streptomyces TaxID=2593676 RepID=UPI001BED0993|nr:MULTISPECIES: hypothetical protein [unclassified Streptomyces]MBT2406337.1 hypothetical protein [Streptomyces sp. ISL-21]MBT2607567.1 hypothetical protein [Streptomyces sp. ISL-87]
MEQAAGEVHPAVRDFAAHLRSFRSAAGTAGGYKETTKATGIGVSTVKAITARTHPRLPSRDTMQLLAKHWGGNPEVWLRRLEKARHESQRGQVGSPDSQPSAAPVIGSKESQHLYVPPQLVHVQSEVTKFQILSKLARASHKELMRTLNLLLTEMRSESPYILTSFTRPAIPANRIAEIWNGKFSLKDDITSTFGDWMNIIFAMEQFLLFVIEKDASEISEAKEWARKTAEYVQAHRYLEAEIMAKHRHVK